jgi:hypothetical protein
MLQNVVDSFVRSKKPFAMINFRGGVTMIYSSLILTLTILGCQVDKDGDGLYRAEDTNAVTSNEDCDDNDSSVKSPSEEICDGIDNDCDGDIDEGVLTTFYLDADGDGYGTGTIGDGTEADAYSVEECNHPVGYVLTNTDCDDSNASVHPNAVEICDELEVDEDCDGEINDEDALGQIVWYVDADRDGYGTSDSAIETVTQCYAPEDTSDYVSNNTDCDDSNGLISPAEDEMVGDAENVDENCDGYIQCYIDNDRDGYGAGEAILVEDGIDCKTRDDDDFDGLHTFSRLTTDCDDTRGDSYPGAAYEEPGSFCMRDADGDGYGDINIETSEQVLGLQVGTDCDDDNSAIFPSATEIAADSIDQNCDGEELCYVDSDSDGYGSSLPPITSTDVDCNGSNEAENTDDCDDNDSTAFPGSAELESTTDCRKDSDGDGYGDSSPLVTGVLSGTDCDDTLSNVYPGAMETCGTDYDDNCDGSVNDSNSIDAMVFYADADSDTYGDDSVVEYACDQPLGYVMDNTDCDDSDAASNPTATELVSDGIDQDCDTYEACYVDSDGDGYGSSSLTYSEDMSCDSGIEADNQDDCDDTSSSAYIGSASLDSITDCMEDSDGDGYGDASPVITEVVPGTDCDDSVSTINPSVTETPANGVDENCNNIELCYLDADGDGFGNDSGTTIGSEDNDCGDSNEATNTDDCNDLDAAAYIGAPETCNGSDDDCDGEVDEGIDLSAPTDAPTWYGDADEDGYGSEHFSIVQCEQPTGYVSDNSDCNDLDPNTSPGANELCFDGIDNDCDLTIDSYSLCQTDASEANTLVSGADENSRAGYAIDAADIDGDGVDDLMVSAPGENNGSVYLIYGPIGTNRDLSSSYDAVFTGDATDNDGDLGLGSAALLADLNGNGLADILISSPGSDGEGNVYVVYSPVGSRFSGSYNINSAANAQIEGEVTDINSACTLSNAGNVDGDGYEDVLIGSCVSNDVSPGYGVILYGQQANMSGSYLLNQLGMDDSGASESIVSAIFIGDDNGDGFGEHLASAGDVNGDGLGEILFGAHLGFSTDNGAAHLLYGDETQLTDIYSTGDTSSYVYGAMLEHQGGSLGSAGDMNGDGYEDFIIGAPESNTNRGYVDIFLGSSTELTGELNVDVTIFGESDNDFFGEYILRAGDLNSDGFGDILIGAPGNENLGSVHIFYGPLTGSIDLSASGESSGKISGQTLSTGLNTNFGKVMALADINANGENDILIASDLNDVTDGQNSGGVFLFTTLIE